MCELFTVAFITVYFLPATAPAPERTPSFTTPDAPCANIDPPAPMGPVTAPTIKENIYEESHQNQGEHTDRSTKCCINDSVFDSHAFARNFLLYWTHDQ